MPQEGDVGHEELQKEGMGVQKEMLRMRSSRERGWGCRRGKIRSRKRGEAQFEEIIKRGGSRS
jgi:hypothetical protein